MYSFAELKTKVRNLNKTDLLNFVHDWCMSGDRSNADLEGSLKLIGIMENDKRSDIVDKLIKQNNAAGGRNSSFAELKKKISNFLPQDQFDFIYDWCIGYRAWEQHNIKRSNADLEEALKLTDKILDIRRLRIVAQLLENGGDRSTNDFKKDVGDKKLNYGSSHKESNYDLYRVSREWLKRVGRSTEDLKYALPFLEGGKAITWVYSEDDIKKIVTSWINGGNRSIDEVIDILSVLQNQDDYRCITQKIAIHLVPGRSRDDIEAIISKLNFDQKVRNDLYSSWGSSKDVSNMSLDEFKSFVIPLSLSLTRDRLKVWLKRNLGIDDNSATLDDCIGLWVINRAQNVADVNFMLSFATPVIRDKISHDWMEKDMKRLEQNRSAHVEVSAEDLPQRWLQARSAEQKNVADLILALSLIPREKRIEILMQWVDQLKREDVRLFSGPGDGVIPVEDAHDFFKQWITKPGRTVEDLEVVLATPWSGLCADWIKSVKLDDPKAALRELALIKDGVHRKIFGENWIVGRSLKEAQDLISHCSPRSRAYFSWYWLKSLQENKYENFVELAKAGNFYGVYNIPFILKAYMEAGCEPGLLLGLPDALYPQSENARVEMMKLILSKSTAEDISSCRKAQLKKFISEIKQDSWAIEVIRLVRAKDPTMDRDILDLAKNRLSGKYQSLAGHLNSKTLGESLSDEGLKNAIEKFSNLSGDSRLGDLFSFYDIIGEDMVVFKSMLKPEVLQELRQDFVPSNQSVYIARDELLKLCNLFNKIYKLPEVQVVSNYLGQTVKNIRLINNPDDFHFGASESLTEEKGSLLEEFRNLANQTRPSDAPMVNSKGVKLDIKFDDEVAKFFMKLCNLEGEISNRDKVTLAAFFNKDKYLLATLLAQKGGLDQLSAVIEAKGDGCFANIGTHVRNAVIAGLVTDVHDQILFSVFDSKINTPILAETAITHHHDKADLEQVFLDDKVNHNYLSPMGLVTALEMEFYDGTRKLRNAWEFLSEELAKHGYEKSDCLDVFLAKLEGKEESAARLASYVIIAKTMPYLLQNEYMQEFANKSEAVVGEVVEMVNKEGLTVRAIEHAYDDDEMLGDIELFFNGDEAEASSGNSSSDGKRGRSRSETDYSPSSDVKKLRPNTNNIVIHDNSSNGMPPAEVVVKPSAQKAVNSDQQQNL